MSNQNGWGRMRYDDNGGDRKQSFWRSPEGLALVVILPATVGTILAFGGLHSTTPDGRDVEAIHQAAVDVIPKSCNGVPKFSHDVAYSLTHSPTSWSVKVTPTGNAVISMKGTDLQLYIDDSYHSIWMRPFGPGGDKYANPIVFERTSDSVQCMYDAFQIWGHMAETQPSLPQDPNKPVDLNIEIVKKWWMSPKGFD